MTAMCPFCEIVGNADLSTIVYSDNLAVGFMDRRPIRPGHVLVVPRAHEPDFFALADEQIAGMMSAAKQIAAAQKRVFQPLRVGMIVAGFDIPHAHLHLVPMHDYHDITSRRLLEDRVEEATPSELAEHARDIRRTLEC